MSIPVITQWNITQPSKRMKSCHLQYVNGSRMFYAKQNISEKDKYHIISLICGIYEAEQMNLGERKEKII